MTADTQAINPAAPTTGPVVQPKKKSAVNERPKFPLALKLFALMAVLILIVVGIAIGVTITRAEQHRARDGRQVDHQRGEAVPRF